MPSGLSAARRVCASVSSGNCWVGGKPSTADANTAYAQGGVAGVLIGARVFQGGMAALMVPQVMAIIHVTFPAGERGKVMGMFGGIVGSAAVAGPVSTNSSESQARNAAALSESSGARLG